MNYQEIFMTKSEAKSILHDVRSKVAKESGLFGGEKNQELLDAHGDLSGVIHHIDKLED